MIVYLLWSYTEPFINPIYEKKKNEQFTNPSNFQVIGYHQALRKIHITLTVKIQFWQQKNAFQIPCAVNTYTDEYNSLPHCCYP